MGSLRGERANQGPLGFGGAAVHPGVRTPFCLYETRCKGTRCQDCVPICAVHPLEALQEHDPRRWWGRCNNLWTGRSSDACIEWLSYVRECLAYNAMTNYTQHIYWVGVGRIIAASCKACHGNKGLRVSRCFQRRICHRSCLPGRYSFPCCFWSHLFQLWAMPTAKCKVKCSIKDGCKYGLFITLVSKKIVLQQGMTSSWGQESSVQWF